MELLAHPTTVLTTTLLAGGEFIADKLPFIPARTNVGRVITRAISGAMAGAAITSAKGGSVLFGILTGGSAAVASTYAAYQLRRVAVERSGIPNPVIALLEDALVLAGGWVVFQSLLKDRKE